MNDGKKETPRAINDSESIDGRFGKLIREAQSGDRQALNELLQNHRDYLTAIANRQIESGIRPKVAASDLVQESMIGIQGNIEQFRGNSSAEFRAWIRQILANDLRDAKRKFRGTIQRNVAKEHQLDDSRMAQPAIQDDQLTPATDARAREESEVLQRAMNALPENYQQVLQMRNWDEMSFEAIGKQMECSPDAARKLWFRAVQRLKSELGTELE